ncbi:FMN-dependent NADH-azoreductase [Mycoplasma phocoeninasale]|uniref:FMN-dependent NADH-azoreductase n=1 Tax=Mycoplasma phocoeninasale TaxID=2726117 RepID=A0A858U601_9MOLU|nr:FMN-dependent NADH-azoreductase [Mycoplasma phocoeninasale]MBN0970662.1 FMN-dependent NADH-azoreductase [Mycoplasma phocoeninasale]QJG66228.1 FMN-dependent NADH-azoreductase [Mycoplasma phocoeninasale]
MAKVLVLNGSPMPKMNSTSYKLLQFFVNEYRKNNPKDEIIELDLNELEMSTVGLTSKNIGEFFDEENSAKYIKLLKEVNKIIISVPMINLAIPTLVKNFFDRIIVAGQTFTYEGSTDGKAIGLLDHLKIQIIATQGSPTTALEPKQVQLVEMMWRFLGSKISPSFLAPGTNVPPLANMTKDQIVDTFKDELIAKAKAF